MNRSLRGTLSIYPDRAFQFGYPWKSPGKAALSKGFSSLHLRRSTIGSGGLHVHPSATTKGALIRQESGGEGGGDRSALSCGGTPCTRFFVGCSLPRTLKRRSPGVDQRTRQGLGPFSAAQNTAWHPGDTHLMRLPAPE